jgi:hypothetical protein
MKKVLIIAVLFAVLGVSFLMNPTQGKTKPYYSGEAVNYNGQVYIGSVNSGKFELFALENGEIMKKTAVTSPANESKEFYDLLFSKESGRLYVYLVNGRVIYKYDISNPAIPSLVMKIKDNSADWTSAIARVNGQLVTVTNRGTRIWNKDYQIVDSYNMISDKNYGAASFSSGNVAVSAKNKLAIYSTASRTKVAEYTIAVNDENTKRDIVSDSDSNLVYVVDDKSLKAINVEGQVVREFKHVSSAGYDVAVSAVNPNYLYFSDGLGVVKVDKETLKPTDWSWTIRTAPQGSWAMGLRTVNDGAGEKIVVFNGSNILVLDDKMNQVAFYESVEKETASQENLSLSLDKNRGAANTQVLVRGTGFGLGEDLKIEFDKILVSQLQADANGRFETIVAVPAVDFHRLPTDIKVTGKSSKKTYSVSFLIE